MKSYACFAHFLYKSVLHTKLKKSDGSRKITCCLASCFFSCSKTQKWMHWHFWCTALPNFCLGSESFGSPVLVAAVMPSLTLLLAGMCCTCCSFALPSLSSGFPSALSHHVDLMFPTHLSLNLCSFCIILLCSLSHALHWVWVGMAFLLILYHNTVLFFCNPDLTDDWICWRCFQNLWSRTNRKKNLSEIMQ